MSETLKSIYDAFVASPLGFIVGVILTWPFAYWYARSRYQTKLDARESVIAAQKERIAVAENKIGGALGDMNVKLEALKRTNNLDQTKPDANESVIEVLKERIAVAESKIGGALGGMNVKLEALKALEALERTNNLTMGPPWRSLTPDERTRLETALQQITPKPRMQIMYANHLGAALAKEFGDVFVSAGWPLATPVGHGSGLGLGISTGRGPNALLVTNAIEAATDFAVFTLPRFAQWPSDIVTLSIGINANEDGTAPRDARRQTH